MLISLLKSRWTWLAALAVGYLLAATLGGCADRLILYPTTGAVYAQGATSQMLRIGESNIEIWKAVAPASGTTKPAAFVLEFTGNATRAEHVAMETACRFRSCLVEVWAMNYPGYGGSEGPAKLKAIAPAALGVFDKLSEHAQGRPIYVVGTSLGTTAALCVAANRPVAGVLLRNPPALRQLILGRYGWWNLWLAAGPIAWQVPSDLDSVANAKKVRVPGIFVMSEQDEVVPPAYQKMVLEAYAGPKRIISLRGAGHNSFLSEVDESRLQEELGWLMGQTMAGSAISQSGSRD